MMKRQGATRTTGTLRPVPTATGASLQDQWHANDGTNGNWRDTTVGWGGKLRMTTCPPQWPERRWRLLGCKLYATWKFETCKHHIYQPPRHVSTYRSSYIYTLRALRPETEMSCGCHNSGSKDRSFPSPSSLPYSNTLEILLPLSALPLPYRL